MAIRSPTEAISAGERGQKICHVPYDSQQTHIALAWDVPPYRDPDSLKKRRLSPYLVEVPAQGSLLRFGKKGLVLQRLCGLPNPARSRRSNGLLWHDRRSSPETLDVMLHEIKALPGTITDDELDRVKAPCEKRACHAAGINSSPSSAMARQWFHLGRIRTLAEDLERLDNLTVESIENWLAKNPLTEITTVSLGRDPLEVPDAVSP